MAEPKGFLVVPLGFNPSGILRALELDESDRLKVLVDSITGIVSVSLDGQTGTLKVEQQSPTNLATGNHGWYSSAWQKSPIPFGPSASVGDRIEDLNLAAGTNNISGTTVPAGEAWVIKQLAGRYTGTVGGVVIRYDLIIGGTTYVLHYVTPVVSAAFYPVSVDVTLFPGDNLSLFVSGATAGNDALLTAVGYRMDLDQ